MPYYHVQAILFGLGLSKSVKHFDGHARGILMQVIDEQGVERPTRNVSNSDVFNDWLPMPVPTPKHHHFSLPIILAMSASAFPFVTWIALAALFFTKEPRLYRPDRNSGCKPRGG